MHRSICSTIIVIISFNFILCIPQARLKNDKKLKDNQTASSQSANSTTTNTTLSINSTLPTINSTSIKNEKKDFDQSINNTIETESTAIERNILDCDPIYLRFSSNHTACKDYNDKCNITKVRNNLLIC